MNFWRKLKRPFFILAPMDDVTDVVFREIVSEVGKPDVLVTEFTNVEGLNSAGFEAVSERLKFTEKQRPIVAQIWGLKPENYFKSAQIIKKMGFDGIDINMGCPVKDVTKTGACSAMINTPNLAEEVIKATIKGAGGLPVSVKTRLGLSKYQPEWIEFLLKLNIDLLIIHGRTVKEMSKVPTHWDKIGEVREIRDRLGVKTLIIGNGDVKSRQQGEELAKEYGLDGIMIGRGIFDDIALFNRDKKQWSIEERVSLLLRHAKLYQDTWGDKKHFLPMRKFVKVYIKDFVGASELRAKLMEANSYQELSDLCSNLS